jgi:DNA-binding GntR family transcriptional regulator
MPPSPRRRSLLVSQLVAFAQDGTHEPLLGELRRVIVDGGAPPGTSIPVGDVAELFGVSAIPVREALKTLVGERLVEHRPNAGYVVAQLTRAELSELYMVRGVLESAALRIAVDVATEQDAGHAAQAHRALEEGIVAGDPRAYHRESRRFHVALIAPSRMHRLLHMVESAWNLTEPFQPMTHVDPRARLQLHADHQEMLDAFLARDTARLLATSELHHRRLETVIAGLPASSGLRADG